MGRIRGVVWPGGCLSGGAWGYKIAPAGGTGSPPDPHPPPMKLPAISVGLPGTVNTGKSVSGEVLRIGERFGGIGRA